MIDPVPYIVNGDNVGPVDATKVPRYAGQATFAKLPSIGEIDRADAVIVGVPFDTGVTYRPGARFGPGHIRESSRLLRPYNPALDVSPFASLQVVDAGDLAVNPFDLARRSPRSNTAPATCSNAPRTCSPWAVTTRSRCRCCGRSPPSTARSRSCTSTRTWTPGTPTSAPPTPTAPRSAALRRRACSTGSLHPRRHPRPAVHHRRPRPGRRTGLHRHLRPRGRPPRRRRDRRARRRPGRRPPGVRLGRHRRARSGARSRHRNPRGRRPDQPRTARRPALLRRPEPDRRRYRRGRAGLRPRPDHRHRGRSRGLRTLVGPCCPQDFSA